MTQTYLEVLTNLEKCVDFRRARKGLIESALKVAIVAQQYMKEQNISKTFVSFKSMRGVLPIGLLTRIVYPDSLQFTDFVNVIAESNQLGVVYSNNGLWFFDISNEELCVSISKKNFLRSYTEVTNSTPVVQTILELFVDDCEDSEE